MARCLQHLLDAARSSSGVILNTFQDLEDSDLQKITNGLGVPMYTVGPLHKISSGTESSLLAQDQTCLKWLDKQEADSVLYVSLGSLASMDEKELLGDSMGPGQQPDAVSVGDPSQHGQVLTPGEPS